eukprot:s3625_g3.t1
MSAEYSKQEEKVQQDLHETTMKEVELGHLHGPFSEAEITAHFGTDKWLFNPRFALYQGSENKVGDQLISQIEFFVYLALRFHTRQDLHNRLGIAWIDNESARFVAIKGSSDSFSLMSMSRVLQQVELEAPSSVWLERPCNSSTAKRGGLPTMAEESDPEEMTHEAHLEAYIFRLLAMYHQAPAWRFGWGKKGPRTTSAALHFVREAKALFEKTTAEKQLQLEEALARAQQSDEEKCNIEQKYEELAKELQTLQASAVRNQKQPAKALFEKTTSERQLQLEEEPKHPKILRGDLSKVGFLGAGSFGAVELYEHKATGDTFALKCISKGLLVQTGHTHNVILEKELMLKVCSPFIVRLYETYSDEHFLYFLLEPALGGCLSEVYPRQGLYGNERCVLYHCAGVLCALQHLHQQRIIYRDLKPENVLLKEKGHVKVTDMGLAKQLAQSHTFTMSGTPDFMAPEVISMSGHNEAADWWTFGVFIYELMCGKPPFQHPCPIETMKKVVYSGIHAADFPQVASPWVNLVKSLCAKEPSERPNPWFEGFNWEEHAKSWLQAPFVPKVENQKDLTNFTALWKHGGGRGRGFRVIFVEVFIQSSFEARPDLPAVIAYVDDGSSWDKDFATA